MARLLRIESCWHCVHRQTVAPSARGQDDQPVCEMADCRRVNTDDIGIPDWCPLPEAEEKGDGEWEAEERLWGRE